MPVMTTSRPPSDVGDAVLVAVGVTLGLYGETEPIIEQSRPHGDDNCVTRV